MADPGNCVDVLIIQSGRAREGVPIVDELLDLVDRGCGEKTPDFVVLSELATTPSFCLAIDKANFDLAEPLSGPTVRRFSEAARNHRCHIVLPFFEHDERTGAYYNTVALIGPDGRTVPGTLPDGTRVPAYRKVHLSENWNAPPGVHEKYYFRPGPGFPIFPTPFGPAGMLICYDRSFPESWRTLRLMGATFVFLPVLSWRSEREEMFFIELRCAAVQNGIFIVSSSKGGTEDHGRPITFFGSSCAIGPDGDFLLRGPAREGPALLRTTLDLSQAREHALSQHYLRDRVPKAYELVSSISP
ncbi:MAG: carbon-nitrogen hydrolase family protein [Nitrospinota bacterium]|nr:carbon-nitrogen hydrolase family protein [Nitrospinota bacterium]MDP7384659.1 carbon-nitrogen hydrolase family protein [Nitrospinota bacterium]